MKHIIKTFGLLSVFVVFSGAFAATSRVSVMNTASPRLPSIAGHIVNTGTTTTTTSSTASYLDNSECIEKYTDCIKADDVCGPDLEECTTKVLFHGQMAKCSNVLYQCSSSGITALFGINNISALGACTTNSNGDITGCTYPSDGSVLGQLIIGAKISNQLSTEQCVKSYTRCLQREGNCGADFELCTTKKEFKKQALLCDSTLQRCQSEGKTQLFGSVQNADSLTPGDETRIGQLIANGQSTAAMNAVKTCQKVTDNCLISACTQNPLRCVEGVSLGTIGAADFVTGANELNGTTSNTQNLSGTTVDTTTGVVSGGSGYTDNYLYTQTGSDIRKMLKAQCLETIGANKYCHMTYREKSPSNKDLMDIDLQEDVFSLAYAARKDAVNTKIQEAVKKFDTKAKDACVETIKSCAMRSCGGGIGSVCYRLAGSLVMNGGLASSTTAGLHVNRAPYNEIKVGCEAIVNADANCIYAATSGDRGGYQYAYTDSTTFKTLFPEYNTGNSGALGTANSEDPIGVVSKLNSLLATSYNDAAIEDMKKKCQTVALSCVKSMCGKDYVNCYRNRTDIVLADAGAYNTGNGSLDRSMNKVGGVLDYNIVMGLCMNNVKTSSVCEEHLKVATAEWRNSADTNAWDGANSVREAWLGANTTTVNTTANSVVIACSASTTTTADGADCTGTMEPVNGDCVGIMDEDGCVYDTPVTQSNAEYALDNGAKTLFQTMLVDVEKEAQAKYNAKLTKEQNVCLANNHNNPGGGGIIGSQGQNGSTFQWVKLRSSKIPKNYQMKGLQTKDFIASNDLYGSFCRMRVTIQSDDKDIQDQLGEDAVAYFAVGDAFTCGSWISQDKLKKISNSVADRAKKEAGKGSDKEKFWDNIVGVASAVGGFVGTDLLQKNNFSVGGLLGGDGYSATKDKKSAAENCEKQIDEARTAYYVAAGMANQTQRAGKMADAVSKANRAKSYAREAGVDVSKYDFTVSGTYATSGNTYKLNPQILTETYKVIENATKKAYAAEQRANYINKAAIRNAAGDVKTKAETLQGIATKETHTNTEAVSALNDLRNAVIKFNSIDDSYQIDQIAITFDNLYDIKQDYSILDEVGAYGNFNSDLNRLAEECSKAKKDTESKSNPWINVAGAALAGWTGFQVRRGIMNMKYEEAANEAVKEWMNEVGNHIECYVGTEPVGTYGEVVALEID